MTLLQILVILGVTIVAVLSVIAIYLVSKVFKLNKQRSIALTGMNQANDKANQEYRERLNKSIQLLAGGLDANELSLTEASIRISGLLDALAVDDDVKKEFSAFYQLTEKTQHIPYLKAWKNLSAAEQNQFDLERIQQEAIFQDFVLDAAKRINQRQF